MSLTAKTKDPCGYSHLHCSSRPHLPRLWDLYFRSVRCSSVGAGQYRRRWQSILGNVVKPQGEGAALSLYHVIVRTENERWLPSWVTARLRDTGLWRKKGKEKGCFYNVPFTPLLWPLKCQLCCVQKSPEAWSCSKIVFPLMFLKVCFCRKGSTARSKQCW